MSELGSVCYRSWQLFYVLSVCGQNWTLSHEKAVAIVPFFSGLTTADSTSFVLKTTNLSPLKTFDFDMNFHEVEASSSKAFCYFVSFCLLFTQSKFELKQNVAEGQNQCQ